MRNKIANQKEVSACFLAAVFFFLAILSTSAACALAQGMASTLILPQPSVKLTTPTSTANIGKLSDGPSWQELTVSQRIALKPLAANWNTLGEVHKKKWIAIALSYKTLKEPEQIKLHSRMTEWVSLSQQQRAQARSNFSDTKELTPLQKAVTWQAYQALSQEEKQKLALAASSKKPMAVVTTVKPASPARLTAVPVTRKTNIEASKKLASVGTSVSTGTLLPITQPTLESDAQHKH